MPSLLEAGIDSYLKLSWLLPLGVLTLTNPKGIFNRNLAFFYVFVAVFFIYCFADEAFNNAHFVGNDVYNMAICLMVTVVSFAYWQQHASDKNLQIILLILLITSLFLAITIYTNFLVGYDLNSRQYAFKAKNSMGSILLNAEIVVITCSNFKSKAIKISIAACLSIIFIIICLLKSRATLLGAVFILIYYLLINNNWKLKITLTLFLSAIILYIIITPEVYHIVVDNIILANRDAGNVNDLSSGRMELIAIQLQKLRTHLFFGSGNVYLDCFPIVIIIQYGIVGASIVFAFLFKIGRIIYNNFRPRKNLYEAVFLLFFTLVLNGFFEGYPPFGPGIKCFVLWMVFGFSFSQYTSVKKQRYHMKKFKSISNHITTEL